LTATSAGGKKKKKKKSLQIRLRPSLFTSSRSGRAGTEKKRKGREHTPMKSLLFPLTLLSAASRALKKRGKKEGKGSSAKRSLVGHSFAFAAATKRGNLQKETQVQLHSSPFILCNHRLADAKGEGEEGEVSKPPYHFTIRSSACFVEPKLHQKKKGKGEGYLCGEKEEGHHLVIPKLTSFIRPQTCTAAKKD